MILNAYIDEQKIPVEVPDDLPEQAEDFFAKMDADMDRGWQMSRTWVDDLSPEMRCQVAADRILTALHQDNEKMLMLMAGYILSRLPGVTDVRIDTNGEMLETEFIIPARL